MHIKLTTSQKINLQLMCCRRRLTFLPTTPSTFTKKVVATHQVTTTFILPIL